MVEEINFYTKSGEYGWLSNFHPQVQTIEGGLLYLTNEHYYQSQKAKDASVMFWIACAPSPFLAMKAGRSLRAKKEFRDDWTSDVRIKTMLIGLRAKFGPRNEKIRKLLLATGDAVIHEASPYDKFWGKKGQDWLGILLMRVRDEIRSGEL